MRSPLHMPPCRTISPRRAISRVVDCEVNAKFFSGTPPDQRDCVMPSGWKEALRELLEVRAEALGILRDRGLDDVVEPVDLDRADGVVLEGALAVRQVRVVRDHREHVLDLRVGVEAELVEPVVDAVLGKERSGLAAVARDVAGLPGGDAGDDRAQRLGRREVLGRRVDLRVPVG